MTEEGSLSEAIGEDLAVEDEEEYFRIDALTSSGSPVFINSVKTWNVSKLDKKTFLCCIWKDIQNKLSLPNDTQDYSQLPAF